MRNYDELISDLDDWEAHNGFKIGPDGWLAGMGTFDLAVAFTSLFWPEFVVHDNSVFIGPFTDQRAKNYLSWQASESSDKRETEKVMNHQHLLDLFPNQDPKPTREQILYLGRALKDMWQLKLNRDFPEREMVVFFHEDVSDDLMDYEITFWQER